MYLNEAQAKYQELWRFGYSKPLPCTTKEIEKLERWVGCRLPSAYREFLLWMGHSGGGFLNGSDCFYEHLKNIQTGAKELLIEDHFPGVLPQNAFVFFMHQGYQFNFFYLGKEEDPPVFFYFEESPVQISFQVIYSKFSNFLLTEIDGHIRLENAKIKRKNT